MAYNAQEIAELDILTPDGNSEPKSILDDSDREIKRAMKQTSYDWAPFLNDTGIQLVKGDIVAVGPAIQNVILDDTVGSYSNFLACADAAIAPSARGLFARSGVSLCKVAGVTSALHFVRKSATARALEDMGVMVGSTTPRPAGAVGFALESVTSGLCTIYLYPNTVALAPVLTSVPYHSLTFTNRAGATLNAGDVVSPSPSDDTSVMLNDVVGSFRQVVVAIETVPHLTPGKFVQNGVVDALGTGAIVRGNYVRKSNISKALEDSGIPANDTASIPVGAVGIAVTGIPSSGLFKVLLFGATRSTFIAVAATGVKGLLGANTPATTAKFDLNFSQVVMMNPLNGETVSRFNASALTCDFGIQGRNGRDQSSVFTAGSWINLFATWDGLTLALRASVRSPSQGPLLALGETHFCYLTTLRWNASAQITPTNVKERWSYYVTPVALLSAGGALSATTISISNLVPPTASSYNANAYGHFVTTVTSSQTFVLDFIMLGGWTIARARLSATTDTTGSQASDGFSITVLMPGSNSLAYYWNIIASTISLTLSGNIDVMGYENPS